MQRNTEHIRGFVKRLLGAVTMMNIPIDDGDSINQTLGLRLHHTQGYVAKDTKPATFVALSMMSRWPGQSIGVCHLAAKHLANGSAATTDR